MATNKKIYLLKNSLKDRLVNDKFMLVSFILTLLLNIILWGFLFWRVRPTEYPIYLHYNIYFGIDLIGAWYQIYIIPLSGLAVFLINFMISLIIYNKEKIISYFLMITALLSQLFLILSALFIIYLNL